MTSRCPTCTGGFSGVLVYKTYKGRHYHTDCLRCTGCGATVGGKSSQPVEFEAEVRTLGTVSLIFLSA